MARAKITVTNIEELKKFGEERGYNGLVKTVTEERADSSLLRKLANHAIALKQTIPGVTIVTANAKDANQVDIEEAIAKTPASAPVAVTPVAEKPSAPAAIKAAVGSTNNKVAAPVAPVKKKA